MAKERMLAKVKVIYPAAAGVKNEKWVTVGAAFKLDSGQINIILDTLPIRDWNGQLVLFPDERGGEGGRD
jgi:hypothetical protein